MALITDKDHPDLVCGYFFYDNDFNDVTGDFPASLVGEWSASEDGFTKKAENLNSYVSIPGLGTWFSGKSEFTIALEDVIPDMKAGTSFVFCVSNVSHTNPYYRVSISISDSAFAARINGYTTGSVVAYNWPSSAPEGVNLYTIRFKDGEVDLFFGSFRVESGTVSYPIGATKSTAMMGRIPAANSSGNAAAINRKSFRVFSRALTDEEIETIAADSSGYEISGTIERDGIPLSTSIKIYDANTGELISRAESSAGGVYVKAVPTNDPVLVVPDQPDGYRPLMHGPITPASRN